MTDRKQQFERLILPLGTVVTLTILIAIFYLPVWSVLQEAVTRGGSLSVAPLLDVLRDPFYLGSAHLVFSKPLAAPGAFLGWVGTAIGSLGLTVTNSPPWIVLNWEIPPYRLGLFGFTAFQATLSTIASVLLGLPGAYLLARYEFRGRRTLRSLTIVPFVLPSVMVVVGFVAMFSRRGLVWDVVHWLEGLLGPTLVGSLPAPLGAGPIVPLFSLEIIVLAHAFYNAPLVTRLVSTAWSGVDARTVETARAAGASPWRAFRDIVYPQLRTALLTAALLTFVFTFLSFAVILELGGLRLATVEVWLYARVQSLDLAEAATLATLETVLSLVLTVLYLRYEARRAQDRSGGRSLSRQSLFPADSLLQDPRRLGLVAYGAVALIVFVGPIFAMVIESVTTPTGAFTIDYWAFLFERQSAGTAGTARPLPAVINSLMFGIGTLILAVPMGVVVAVVGRRGGRARRWAEAVLMAPLAVSGVVVGLGLLQTHVFGTVLFGQRIVLTGAIPIVFAHAVAAYPFVTRTVAPELARLDERLVDAARALGATRTRALLDIELPMVASGVLAGAAFAFAISVGEFDSTVVLAEGVDSYTMPVAVERYIGNRSIGPSLGPATAMGCVLLAVTAISFVVIDRLGGWWEP